MRLPDWEARLSAAFVAAMGREFVYGEHDCCLFVADCVLAVTGEDVAAAWRGRYDTLEGGLKLARARNVVALASRLFTPTPPALARRGDLAAAKAGVVAGQLEMMMFVVDHALLRGPGGTAIHRAAAARAWRVG